MKINNKTNTPKIFGASFYKTDLNQQIHTPEQDEFFNRMGRIMVKDSSAKNIYQKKLASLQEFVKNSETE